MSLSAIDRLIVALDHGAAASALAQVDALGEQVQWYKVGLELYLAAGASIIAELQQRRKKVFLDLKLHDIPETVKRATRIAASHGAELLTVHAGGGLAMLQAACDGAAGTTCRIVAVTVLTSLDVADLQRDGNPLSVEDLVCKRAQLARAAGCAGVVASPQEVAAIRAQIASDFLVITPGVRPGGIASGDDQKRIASARAARQAGADCVVVGRPIRDAALAAQAQVVDALLTELA